MTWNLIQTKADPFAADADFSLTQVYPSAVALPKFSAGAKATTVAFVGVFSLDGAIVTANKGSFTLDVYDVSYGITDTTSRVVARAELLTGCVGNTMYTVNAAKLQGMVCVSVRDIVAATGATLLSIYYKTW